MRIAVQTFLRAGLFLLPLDIAWSTDFDPATIDDKLFKFLCNPGCVRITEERAAAFP
jgi:hypothetical protein